MNVLVLAAHGLHCHWLGPYGNEWVSTPAFDALAVEAAVFDQHFADDPSPAGFATSCPAATFQSLRGGGVYTAFVDDRKARPADEFAWDLVVATDSASHPTPGDALIAAVESSLDQVASRSPWLLWVETDRLIPPWDFDAETYQHYASATGGFDSDEESPGGELPAPTDHPAVERVAPHDHVEWHRLHNSFAAAVTSFDAELDVLSEVFRERKVDQSAVWVVTSGYGWPLGEHGVIGPSRSRMHTELVHLPLIIRLPERRQGMRRVSAFTQTADLGATLLDLFGIHTTIESPGGSVIPLTLGSTGPLRELVRSASARPTHVERGLRTPDRAYLSAVPETGDPQRLYQKPDDVWEVNDLAPRLPDECDCLAALLNKPTPSAPEPSK